MKNKKCPWCGRENGEELMRCAGCGTELPVPPKPPVASPLPTPKFLNLSAISEVIIREEGFPYPNWGKILEQIELNVPQEKREEAINEAARQWLELLRGTCGENYFLDESRNFFVVSCREKEVRKNISKVAEDAWIKIQNALAGLNRPKTSGKRVLLLFDQTDDYYRYISHFYPEGSHKLNGGVFLKEGYGHIAIPSEGMRTFGRTLAHELAHNALFGLPVPLWLNEGVAMRFETVVAGQSRTYRDTDLIDDHRQYWTTQSIQGFWQGATFSSPEHSKLAYSLANILVGLIIEDRLDFKTFLQNAHFSDNGSAAAIKYLGRSLGTVAGIFLGPGDWEPKLVEPAAKTDASKTQDAL